MRTRINQWFKIIQLWLTYVVYKVKYDEDYDKLLQSFCNELYNPRIEYFYDDSLCRIVFSQGTGWASREFAFNLTEPLLTHCTMYSVRAISDKDGEIMYDYGESISGIRASIKTTLRVLELFVKPDKSSSHRAILNKMKEVRHIK